MDKIEDEVQGLSTAHTRRIEQVGGEIHDLSCQNTRFRTEYENQQELIDELQSDLEIKSMSLEDMIQYSRRNCLVKQVLKRQVGRIQTRLSRNFPKTN